MEYPKAIKNEILSILQDRIENNREPGDLYTQIIAKFGVNRKPISNRGSINTHVDQLALSY